MDIMMIGIIAVPVILAVAIGFVVFRVVLKAWYKIPSPDEALVVSGKSTKEDGSDEGSDLIVSTSNGMFVNPLKRKHSFISLRARQITASPTVQTSNNVTIRISGVATVKVGGSAKSIEAAARRFSTQDDAIEEFTSEQLEGSLRGVAANLTVKELMQGRSKLSDEITEEVGSVLERQGLELDSFQIQSISDDNGYVEALGAEETERVTQEANIARINREREVNRQRLATEEENLKEQTVYDKNQADSMSEVGQANARARQAEALTEAEHEQKVLQQRAENKQAQLDADVKRAADADLYRSEREADARSYDRIKEAEVSKRRSEADLYTAEKDSEARRLASDAEAEAIRNEGRSKALDAKKRAEDDADRGFYEEEVEGNAGAMSSENALNLYKFFSMLSMGTTLPDADYLVDLISEDCFDEMDNQLPEFVAWANRFNTIWEERHGDRQCHRRVAEERDGHI